MADMGVRLLTDGESYAAVSRRYDVPVKTLKSWFPRPIITPKTTRNNIKISKLSEKVAKPITTIAFTPTEFNNRLSNLAENLVDTAINGAETSRYLSSIARKCALRATFDDKDPEDPDGVQSLKALQRTAALTRVANDAAAPGLALLKAQSEAVGKIMEIPGDADDPSGAVVVEILRLGN